MRLDETLLNGDARGRTSRRDLKLAIDIAYMPVDRSWTNHQCICDIRVCLSLGNCSQDL